MNTYITLNVLFIIVTILYIWIEPRIKKDQRKYILGVLVLIFSALMALRPLETKDTSGYVHGFGIINPGQEYEINFLKKYGGYELGFIYLIQLFKCFSNNYRLFFFFIALIGTSLSIISLKKLSDKIDIVVKDMYAPIFAVYVSNFGLLYNGLSVRAGLAMGLGITAVNYMMSKKRTKAIVLFVLAITIQRSSILFVVIYLIIRFTPVMRRKVHLVIWMVTGILLFSGFGSKMLTFIADDLNYFIIKYQISGYGAFLTDFDTGVGRRDIYLWLLYGIMILLLISSQYYEKYLTVIMVGTFIIVFMHDVRAIARAYDMFYMLMVPMLGVIYNSQTIGMVWYKKVIVLMIISINAVLMLRLCFI